MKAEYQFIGNPPEKYKVGQGQLAVSSQSLYTAGLDTCSALVITNGSKCLLGHIDADGGQYLHQIVDFIASHFDLNDSTLQLKIVGNSGRYTHHSSDVISRIADQLGRNIERYDEMISSMDELYVSPESGIKIKTLNERVVEQGNQNTMIRNGARYKYYGNITASHVKETDQGIIIDEYDLYGKPTGISRLSKDCILGAPVGVDDNGWLRGMYKPVNEKQPKQTNLLQPEPDFYS